MGDAMRCRIDGRELDRLDVQRWRICGGLDRDVNDCAERASSQLGRDRAFLRLSNDRCVGGCAPMELRISEREERPE